MATSKTSDYYSNIIQLVIDNSEARGWKNAVFEWEVYDCKEDRTLTSSCVCGKEGLRHLYRIRNTLNGRRLHPIGSFCINKFERKDLNEAISIKEQLFRLLYAIDNNEFIELSTDLFSRKLLCYFYDSGVFKGNNYNDFNPEMDYRFLLKMFNKRNKNDISERQRNKITAIIMGSIKPYLREMLEDKIKRWERVAP